MEGEFSNLACKSPIHQCGNVSETEGNRIGEACCEAIQGVCTCVFCLKAFGYNNATKMTITLDFTAAKSKIVDFVVSNGSIAVWIRESCKTSVEKANDLSVK